MNNQLPETMRCSRCETDPPRTAFDVTEHEDGTYTRALWCRPCTAEYKRELRRSEQESRDRCIAYRVHIRTGMRASVILEVFVDPLADRRQAYELVRYHAEDAIHGDLGARIVSVDRKVPGGDWHHGWRWPLPSEPAHAFVATEPSAFHIMKTWPT